MPETYKKGILHINDLIKYRAVSANRPLQKDWMRESMHGIVGLFGGQMLSTNITKFIMENPKLPGELIVLIEEEVVWEPEERTVIQVQGCKTSGKKMELVERVSDLPQRSFPKFLLHGREIIAAAE